jgi:hypothetical protein
MTMRYTYRGSPTLLKGLGPKDLSLEDRCHLLKPYSLANKGFLLKIISGDTKANPQYPPAIQSFLTTFNATFAEPTSLPPPRP